MAFHYVDDVFFLQGVEFQDVLAQLLHALLEGCHLLVIAQYAQHIIAGHNPQFRIKSLQHLQVHVVGSIEYYAVNVF